METEEKNIDTVDKYQNPHVQVTRVDLYLLVRRYIQQHVATSARNIGHIGVGR